MRCRMQQHKSAGRSQRTVSEAVAFSEMLWIFSMWLNAEAICNTQRFVLLLSIRVG